MAKTETTVSGSTQWPWRDLLSFVLAVVRVGTGRLWTRVALVTGWGVYAAVIFALNQTAELALAGTAIGVLVIFVIGSYFVWNDERANSIAAMRERDSAYGTLERFSSERLSSIKWNLQVGFNDPIIYADGGLKVSVHIVNTHTTEPIIVQVDQARCVVDGQPSRPAPPAQRLLLPGRRYDFQFGLIDGIDWSKASVLGHVEFRFLFRHGENAEFRFSYRHGYQFELTAPANAVPGTTRVPTIVDAGEVEILEL